MYVYSRQKVDATHIPGFQEILLFKYTKCTLHRVYILLPYTKKIRVLKYRYYSTTCAGINQSTKRTLSIVVCEKFEKYIEFIFWQVIYKPGLK